MLDRCTDATEQRAARPPPAHLAAATAAVEAPGPASATRAGSGWTSPPSACSRRPPDGLIATTDADSERRAGLAARPARRRRRRRAGDRRARSSLGAEHDLAAAALARARAPRRSAAVAREPPARASTTSSAAPRWRVTAATYARGRRPRAARALEDEGFERALRRHGVPIERLAAVRVTTSARAPGRAPRGLAVDLRRDAWLGARTLRAPRTSRSQRLLGAQGPRRSASILPAREVAATIGRDPRRARGARGAGLVDEVLVVDAGSRDGTAAVARGARRARRCRRTRCCPTTARLAARATRCGAGSPRPPATSSPTSTPTPRTSTRRFVRGLLGPLLTDAGVDVRQGRLPAPVPRGDAEPSPTAAAA